MGMATTESTLSEGQLEVRRIIHSFLEEYKSINETNTERHEQLSQLYTKVLAEFRANETIINDAVTSQPLGASRYSKQYLNWLNATGRVETIQGGFHSNSTDIDSSMSEIVYPKDGRLQPAYRGGLKSHSTIGSLFQLAQKKLLPSFQWNSTYYDAIDLWDEGMGGHHRMLSHILYGSDNINPTTLYIVRNEFPELALNESLRQFDQMFDAVNADSNSIISLDFEARFVSREEVEKIKIFFQNVRKEEELEIVSGIKALVRAGNDQSYFSLRSNASQKIMSIDAMYRLLNHIRTIKTKPLWHRQLLVWKQKLLGLNAVDPITCSVLHLATRDNPYWTDDEFNEDGLLSYLPGLRDFVSSIWK